MARRHMARRHTKYLAGTCGVKPYTMHTPLCSLTEDHLTDGDAVNWARLYHMTTNQPVTLVNAIGWVLSDLRDGVNQAPAEGYRYRN